MISLLLDDWGYVLDIAYIPDLSVGMQHELNCDSLLHALGSYVYTIKINSTQYISGLSNTIIYIISTSAVNLLEQSLACFGFVPFSNFLNSPWEQDVSRHPFQ